MRKLLLCLTCLLAASGLVAAGEVTLVKFDKAKKEVTVKDGEAEHTYRITDQTKFATNDKDGNPKLMTYEDALKGLTSDKAPGKLKFDITTKSDEILVAKMKGRKGK